MIIDERNIKMWSTIGARATFGESFERQANLPKFKLEVSERGLYYQIKMECLKHTLYLQNYLPKLANSPS